MKYLFLLLFVLPFHLFSQQFTYEIVAFQKQDNKQIPCSGFISFDVTKVHKTATPHRGKVHISAPGYNMTNEVLGDLTHHKKNVADVSIPKQDMRMIKRNNHWDVYFNGESVPRITYFVKKSKKGWR